MADLPQRVEIAEEGPREGFQIEPGPIPTADKVALIDALSATGLRHIQICSFVNPRLVPGWADAEAVAAGFAPRPGVRYAALWFNANGLKRALAFRDRLAITGSISLSASDAFSVKNLNRDHAANLDAMRKMTAAHRAAGVPVTRVGVMAAFGCNYQGDITPEQVVEASRTASASRRRRAPRSPTSRSPTPWAGPRPPASSACVGAVRERWPELRIGLHLHDTRGLGVANAHAGLRARRGPLRLHRRRPRRLPLRRPEGRGRQHLHRGAGAPLRGDGHRHRRRPRALIEVGRLAEDIVGHALPSELLRAGSLAAFRRPSAA